MLSCNNNLWPLGCWAVEDQKGDDDYDTLRAAGRGQCQTDLLQVCDVPPSFPPQDCFLSMSPAWYQSLIKVLLSRFPQSCRHFDDNGVQYLVSAVLQCTHVARLQTKDVFLPMYIVYSVYSVYTHTDRYSKSRLE